MQHLLASSLLAVSIDNESRAAIAALGVVFFVFLAVFVIIGIVAQWRIFDKAGQPGWAAIIPFYHTVVLMRVAGLSGWWALAPLIVIIPILGLIAFLVWIIWVWHRISVRFGQGVGFTVGLILLPPIFLLILAFGSAQYQAIPSNEQPAQA
jgi:Family of unknown function (DUF5684)